MAGISLTLVVAKEKNRVVFVEADKDFVDILFSFLTLPLGTVIRLLGKQSKLGCVDKLYESVENMDAEYLETVACKSMLLQPRGEAEELCEDLKINVDDLKARRIYRCPTFECFATTHRLFSSVSDARCPCGKAMDKVFHWVKTENKDIGKGDGIFVKGGNRFIISDDLHVTSSFSMEATLTLLEKHGIKDAEALEKKTVDITRDKILLLLKRLMLSTTPLTDTFLLEEDKLECGNDDQECDQLKSTKQTKLEDDSTAEPTSSIRVNVLYDKLNRKVLSAQGGGDFVDVIFSFLTFPLGCIVKLLERYFSMGCLDNLYKSVELLDGSVGMKSEECKNLLSSPKLYTHFGCNNLLRTEEKPSQGSRAHDCKSCWNDGIVATPNSTCKHNINVSSLTQVNPKLSNSGTECGGGYAKKSVRFMITDDMVVTPLSPVSGIDAIKHSRTPFHCLVEKEVVLGEAEVANLMKACLISCTALTKVFCSKKMKKHLY